MTSPVFFDQTGRRRLVVALLAGVLLALALGWSTIFATTIVELPKASAPELTGEREQPLPFRTHLARIRHHLARHSHLFGRGKPATIGFYVPWDEESLASLNKHYDKLNWIVSAQGHVTSDGQLKITKDARLAATIQSRLHRPQFHMMVQNFDGHSWDGTAMARILGSRESSNRLLNDTLAAARAGHWQGVVFDIENLPTDALPSYRAFLAKAHARLAAVDVDVSLTVPADASYRDLHGYARVADHVMLMDYDQHWQGGQPGPIAAQDWFARNLANAQAAVPADKLIVVLGSYAYDWHDGTADALTLDEAWLSAHDSDAAPEYDPASGNSGFSFEDEGHHHTIWMLDAAASWNQLQALDRVEGIALWRLGSEDPGFWKALSAFRARSKPNLTVIPRSRGTDIEGNGEILRIGASPTGGRRRVTFAPDGSIDDETYLALPTPFVVQRSGGGDPHAIALTFDDGPDSTWTPRILSILERRHVPATFFVIGENALDQPSLLRRMANDGDEIGNHTYTHPNLAEETNLGTRLELNATQRMIEAYTGRSTRLFRAPYFGDAEPSTADELGPAQIAQNAGYINVGLHVDPGDWRRPGVAQIVERTLASVQAASPDHSTNIVLLHDSGGNRAQTVTALPVIIDRLRAEGYHFVTVSQLAGLARNTVMPPVRGGDLLAVRIDVGFFAIMHALSVTIRWLFFFAIALGIARALFMSLLAVIDSRGSGAPAQPLRHARVSVIIPAYNEERVIVATIGRVLESDYHQLELIVADDGSKDATNALVRTHYGTDPRVQLLTLANGGKASALNRAIARASGEVIVALDADTQFQPDTIAKLVRWFDDPRIGAVAGNARVGNRVNLVTRWQAIEYVTAQNVERRALDALGAITVVPGAVGAWRREALEAVGLYPEDTLAEDQDLTIAIQRKGWRVAYDVEAIALTEAPESFSSLAKQRFRWSFGTLQCLWKHRAVLSCGRPRGLAFFGIPQAWLFQILFAALSPIIDLALVISIIGTIVRIDQHGWAQTQSDVMRMGAYWVVFVAIDLAAGWIAYRLEPVRQRFPAGWMIMQRLVYRQLMYSVVIRSIVAALRGRAVGWGKLARTGSVAIGNSAGGPAGTRAANQFRRLSRAPGPLSEHPQHPEP